LTLIVSVAGLHAQQKSEADVVLAANHDFDKALSSRDIVAMDKAWAHEPYVIVIHPVSKAASIGWDAVKESWGKIFDRWAEISVSGTTRKSRGVRFRAAVRGIADIKRVLIRGTPIYECAP